MKNEKVGPERVFFTFSFFICYSKFLISYEFKELVQAI
jgi:hypothetical protein